MPPKRKKLSRDEVLAAAQRHIDAVTGAPLHVTKYITIRCTANHVEFQLCYNTSTLIRLAKENGGLFCQPPHFREKMYPELLDELRAKEGPQVVNDIIESQQYRRAVRGLHNRQAEEHMRRMKEVQHHRSDIDAIFDEMYILSKKNPYYCRTCYECLRVKNKLAEPACPLDVVECVPESVSVNTCYVLFDTAKDLRAHIKNVHGNGFNNEVGEYRFKNRINEFHALLNEEKYEQRDFTGWQTTQSYWFRYARYNTMRFNRIVEWVEDPPEDIQTGCFFSSEDFSQIWNENEDVDEVLDEATTTTTKGKKAGRKKSAKTNAKEKVENDEEGECIADDSDDFVVSDDHEDTTSISSSDGRVKSSKQRGGQKKGKSKQKRQENNWKQPRFNSSPQKHSKPLPEIHFSESDLTDESEDMEALKFTKHVQKKYRKAKKQKFHKEGAEKDDDQEEEDEEERILLGKIVPSSPSSSSENSSEDTILTPDGKSKYHDDDSATTSDDDDSTEDESSVKADLRQLQRRNQNFKNQFTHNSECRSKYTEKEQVMLHRETCRLEDQEERQRRAMRRHGGMTYESGSNLRNPESLRGQQKLSLQQGNKASSHHPKSMTVTSGPDKEEKSNTAQDIKVPPSVVEDVEYEENEEDQPEIWEQIAPQMNTGYDNIIKQQSLTPRAKSTPSAAAEDNQPTSGNKKDKEHRNSKSGEDAEKKKSLNSLSLKRKRGEMSAISSEDEAASVHGRMSNITKSVEKKHSTNTRMLLEEEEIALEPAKKAPKMLLDTQPFEDE